VKSDPVGQRDSPQPLIKNPPHLSVVPASFLPWVRFTPPTCSLACTWVPEFFPYTDSLFSRIPHSLKPVASHSPFCELALEGDPKSLCHPLNLGTNLHSPRLFIFWLTELLTVTFKGSPLRVPNMVPGCGLFFRQPFPSRGWPVSPGKGASLDFLLARLENVVEFVFFVSLVFSRGKMFPSQFFGRQSPLGLSFRRGPHFFDPAGAVVSFKSSLFSFSSFFFLDCHSIFLDALRSDPTFSCCLLPRTPV